MADEIKDLKEAGIPVPLTTFDTAKKISALLDEAGKATDALDGLLEEAKNFHGRDLAIFSRDQLLPARHALRSPIDQLELLVSKEDWPVPSYGDLLFHII